MKELKCYVIVNKSKLKYSNTIAYAPYDERLLIFWKKSAAQYFLDELMPNKDRYIIDVINLPKKSI